MLYLDASAFVAAFAPEPMSSRVIAYLGNFPNRSMVSTWTLTEAMSALSLKVRTGALTVAQAGSVQAAMNRGAAVEFGRIAVDDGDVDAAGAFLLVDGPALRAGDALHLALARRSRAQLLTLDRGLARAAAHFSVPVVDI